MNNNLEKYPMGVNKKYDAEVYRSLGITQGDENRPTGEPIPGMVDTEIRK